MIIAAIAGRYGKKEIGSSTGSPEWIWVDTAEELVQVPDADLYLDLGFVPDKERIRQLSGLLPAPVMVDAVVTTLAEIGQPFIRINAWPGFLERGIHELVIPDEGARARIEGLYERLGWQYRIVPDVPGMISSRIVATIINEAYYTLQDEVSTKAEIDTAMKLGTNYPFGPFEWGARIGEQEIHHLLSVLSKTDERYRPAQALTELANRIKM